MKCPRCGETYSLVNIELAFKEPVVTLYCEFCDTHIRVEVTQAMVNRTWVTMDMGFVHDDAKAGA